ncbi:MAG: hypothetical protein WDZ75_02070 [Candidatus Paceibacterota bacterium]
MSSEMEARIVGEFSKHFESFTYHRATGVFRGTKEDTLIVHIAKVDLGVLKKVVSDLREEFRQEGIGIETDGEYIRIID